MTTTHVAACLALSSTMALSAPEGVVLLHGMCRSSKSMRTIEQFLSHQGYTVLNLDYPSRTAPVHPLATQTLTTALHHPTLQHCSTIHFVTHSLGGILVRDYFHHHSDPRLGRVVMIAPPNQGSEVIDRIGHWPLTRWVNGPAGNDLGTDPSLPPHQLGPVPFSCGIIAGNHSINWINSLMIPGPDDGKVSVERTKVTGMADHLTLPSSHPFIMKHPSTLSQTLHFLQNGCFQH